MKIFKSIFSAGHFPFLIFASINIGFGIVLYLVSTYYVAASNIHYYAGLLVFLIPPVVFALSKNRKLMFAAMKGRLLINKNDIKSKKTMVIISKIIAWIFVSMLFLSALEGVLIKTGIFTRILPDINFFKLHRSLVFFMPVLLVSHVVTMKIAMHRKIPSQKIG